MFGTEITLFNGVAVKLEYQNPSGSIKDRPALFILQQAVMEGARELVEVTSGNTGIGLAYWGKRLGIKVTIFMPRGYSVERQKLLRSLGANLILTDGDISDALREGREYLQKSGAYWGAQFENRANWKAHYFTTAPEILEQFPQLKRVVVAVGTGGTLIGIAHALKRLGVEIVAVEPEESPVLWNRLIGERMGQKKEFSPHKIEGIGAGFLPPLVAQNLHLIDRVALVSSDEVMDFWRKILKKGIFGGLSTSANLLVAQRLMETDPKPTLTFAPDHYSRYFSLLQ